MVRPQSLRAQRALLGDLRRLGSRSGHAGYRRLLPGGQRSACMTAFETKSLPTEVDVVAPDGSNVRLLLKLAGGSIAHFELQPGKTSLAVAHRTVEEIWFFLAGEGEMWRKQDERE